MAVPRERLRHGKKRRLEERAWSLRAIGRNWLVGKSCILRDHSREMTKGIVNEDNLVAVFVEERIAGGRTKEFPKGFVFDLEADFLEVLLRIVERGCGLSVVAVCNGSSTFCTRCSMRNWVVFKNLNAIFFD